MNLYTKENKLISVIRSNYQILPVLNRFGIELGVKDHTIEQVCIEKNINVQFFLAILNTYSNEHYFPKDELLSFASELIIDYLKKTHKYYSNYILPKLEEALEQLLQSNKTDDPNATLIRSFFSKYKKEVIDHNQHEESTLFPYLIELTKDPRNSDNRLANHSFEDEHLNNDDKLNDLKNVLLKYLEGNYDANLYNEFIFKLAQFEKDTQDHARIEDAILLPLAHKLEKAGK